MSHQALRTRRGRLGVLAAAAAALLVASCAAPVQQAEPPSSSVPSSMVASSAGNTVTVPGLTSASSEVPTTSSSSEPAPAPETSTEEPAPAPEPEPETTAVDAPDDDYTPPADQPQPQEPPQTEDPAAAPQPANGNGQIVVIDPGHNGANGANPDIINALVDAGFGQTKPCNTTGTSTNAGYTEHEFNWGVATRLQTILQTRGYDVRMTRDSDDGVGPCVNKRAAFGNDANAAAVVSIHGDGDDAGAQGFYVMTAAQDPAGAATAAQSTALADDMRDALVNAGLSPSNHLGTGGLWKRDDLAGLNLSLRPTVMIEMGNMRNSSDAALMTSSAGQQQMAQGIADGVSAYLG